MKHFDPVHVSDNQDATPEIREVLIATLTRIDLLNFIMKKDLWCILPE